MRRSIATPGRSASSVLPALLPAMLALAGLLGGCRTVGPNYAGPPAAAAPQAPAFARAGDLPGAAVQPSRWWTALGDPLLDSLVDRALQANANLDVTRARLRQARAALRSAHANTLPNGTATAMVAHARLPDIGDKLAAAGSGASGAAGDAAGNAAAGAGSSLAIPSSLNLYSVGFDATWEIDLFGGLRRASEAAGASAEAAEAGLADAQLSLAAEVAQAYVGLRSLQAQIALSDQAIARQQRMLDLTARRVQGGTASQLDLVRLQTQLEQTRAQAEPLSVQLDASRDALATLVGQAPGALDAALAPRVPIDANLDGAVPLPPAEVAVGDPAALLKHRPDIRAAERTLAARTAQVGQAEAARFPRLTLFGFIGIGGTHPRDLTHLDDYSAIAAPQLSWNFLDFGRNRARVDQAEGVRLEAEAQYRATVLDALRDAEDALSRFRQRRTTVATVARAKAAAERAAMLTRARQQGGTANMIDVLDTERQLLAAAQNLAEAEAGLTTDFIALQKALGLGWVEAAADAPAVAKAP
jgi:multidrug efflux system outer membrane protein